MRKTLIFVFADLVAAAKPLIGALAAHLVFADQTAGMVEIGMATSGAEGAMLILDRSRQLAAAVQVAAVMPGSLLHGATPTNARVRIASAAWVMLRHRARMYMAPVQPWRALPPLGAPSNP